LKIASEVQDRGVVRALPADFGVGNAAQTLAGLVRDDTDLEKLALVLLWGSRGWIDLGADVARVCCEVAAWDKPVHLAAARLAMGVIRDKLDAVRQGLRGRRLAEIAGVAMHFNLTVVVCGAMYRAIVRRLRTLAAEAQPAAGAEGPGQGEAGAAATVADAGTSGGDRAA
jgi:hypothetical protein